MEIDVYDILGIRQVKRGGTVMTDLNDTVARILYNEFLKDPRFRIIYRADMIKAFQLEDQSIKRVRDSRIRRVADILRNHYHCKVDTWEGRSGLIAKILICDDETLYRLIG